MAVAYVELLDDTGTPAVQAKVDLRNKPSAGSFYISPQMASGMYYLVAYTHGSKSNGASPVLYRKVEIANPYVADDSASPGVVRDQGSERTREGLVPTVRGNGGLDIRTSFNLERVAKRQVVEFDLMSYLDSGTVDADLSISIYGVNALQNAPEQVSVSRFTPQRETGITDEREGRLPSAGEFLFHQLRIQYREKDAGKPIVGQEAFLTIVGRYPKLYVATTDSSGIATFFVRPFYGKSDMATQIAGGRLSDIQILSPFISRHVIRHVGDTDYDAQQLVSYNQVLQAHGLNVQLENLFHNENRAQFHERESDAMLFYDTADKVYFLDDYTRFVLMEEVFEYILQVNIRRSRGEYPFRVFDEYRGAMQSGVPLLVLDGVSISNAKDLIEYDPLKGERVETITSKFIFGRTVYDGVINFYTYEGNLEGFTLQAGVTLFDYDGLQRIRKFFSPDFTHDGQRNSRLPDRRNLLLWNPQLPLDELQKATVKFTTSDVPGDYVIVIEGVDKQGNLGSLVKYFTVE